ncbi:transmembrane protein [Ceratobasidium sp. AG-Ba]|nr:transmembrane protein [Ceratobasidium sp. AG-Ba]
MRCSGILVAILPVVVRGAIPLSEQRPLIARVDQPYSWSLSPLTFNDADTPYISLRNAPDWLVYDNATSTFRGRPSTEDVGVTTVRVRKHDGTNDHFLVCVTDMPPPTVHIPLALQLVPGNPSISSGFTFPAPSVGVRVPPKWSFSIGFDGNTFITPDGRKIFYYATLDNGLPLPDWVAFNNWTMTFDGVAPPENRPVALSILLHGSDRWGFRAIHQQFELVVGPRTHLLGIDGTSGLETVNVTGGVPFTHSIQTFGGLTIDGVQVVSTNVSRVEVNVSSVPWITFDNTTRTIAGLPPTSAIGHPPCILPVLITSDYNDTVATNLNIAVLPSYFNTAFIQPLNVSSGSFLTFSTQPYFSHARSSLAVVVPRIIPRAAASWLSYNSANDTLSGLVPRSTYNEVNVTFYATDLETHAVSAVSMLLSIASNETLDPGPGTTHMVVTTASRREQPS